MIEWASPIAFLLLVPTLLLPFQRWLIGVNKLLVARASSDERRWTVRLLLARLPDALRVLGLIFVITAMARPQITHRDVVVQSDGLDILLALDTSGSMRQEDFSIGLRRVNRLQVAKGVMASFIKEREFDRIGVVVFGEEAFTHVPLTLDHDTLINVLNTVELGIAGPNQTAIGSAIAVSARRLKQVEAPSRILILLTDGRSNAGALSPQKAAEIAAAVGIRVYTIGVGAASRSPFGRAEIDEPTLKAIADITGGRYFRAQNTQALKAIYRTINDLETSPAEVRELVEHEELFRRFLVPGVLLLGLQLLLSLTVLRRGP